MALTSLNQFLKPRTALIRARNAWLRWRYGVGVGPEVQASLSSRFHSKRRGAIVVEADTLVAFKTLLTAYDPSCGDDRKIHIGRRCFIGGGSVILPGVTIGDGSIVGAGSVVFDCIPDRCLVAGNPAKILRRDIETGRFGRLSGADAATRAFFGQA